MSTLGPTIAPSTPAGPHRVIYRIPRDLLIQFLLGERSLDIPPGAICAGFWPDHRLDGDAFKVEDEGLCVSFEHPSFEEVTWKVPVIDVVEKKPNQIAVAKRKAISA